MTDLTPTTLLIVPCFNEEKRLDMQAFINSAENIKILFANDGSSDGTSQLISKFVDNKKIFLFDANNNLGKAQVIQEAYRYANENELLKDIGWVGYWDADLATPLEEVEQMYIFARNLDHIDSIWGSRVDRLGSKIVRSKVRHYLGRIFATIVAIILKVKSYDSQCGAKLFTKSAAQEAFKTPFITKWIFDIEILLRLKEQKIIEFPLNQWTDVPGSKVNIKKDIYKVCMDIYQLWKKYLK